MWNWLCNLLAMGRQVKSRSYAERRNSEVKQLPPATIVVNTSEVSTETVDIESTLVPCSNGDLYQVLAIARQEALNPIMTEVMREAIDAGVNKALPELFKKSLMTKEDLVLIGKVDVAAALNKRIDDDDWKIIKYFIISELNDKNIKAGTSSNGEFVKCYCQNILETIKDVSIFDNRELPRMNSIGIYR